MSKILRRPMFRGGGKVSSYGTGIASGLADGGMPLLVGQHPNSAKGPDGREMHKEVLPNLNIFNKNYKDQDYYEKRQEYQAYEPEFKTEQDYLNAYNKDLARQEDDLLMTYGIDDYSGFQDSVARDLSFSRTEDGRDKFIDKKRIAQNKIIENAANYDLDKQTDLEKLLISQSKVNEPTQRTEAEIEADLLKRLQGTKLTDEEKLAEVGKEQAFFEKLLGGGKSAMIDDLSTMGLNYASGALKEGATVKSSFADFFEKEAKRPSRRMKVKDAATQAAIQSYLTGKTSLQKFQNELDGYGVKMKMKSDIEKKAEENMPFVKIKNSLSGNMKDREKTKAAAELYVSAREKNTGKGLTIIDDVDDTSVLLASPENEGQYFMNKDTKQVFKIVEGIKQIIYGG
jgi:hypothetical protein